MDFPPVPSFPLDQYIHILHTGKQISTVSIGEVTSLNHEVLNHSVEPRALISIAFFSRAKNTKVLGGLWHSFAVQSYYDSPKRLITGIDIEVDL